MVFVPFPKPVEQSGLISAGSVCRCLLPVIVISDRKRQDEKNRVSNILTGTCGEKNKFTQKTGDDQSKFFLLSH